MMNLKVQLLIGIPVTMGFLSFFNQKDAPKATARPSEAFDFKADAKLLRSHVKALTSTSKPRSYLNATGLGEAADYIQTTWQSAGLETSLQKFVVRGRTYHNVLTHLGPDNSPRIVIGAHYDVAGENPGADDNASGIAGILELGRLLKSKATELKQRIDLVAYCLEEPPFFASSEMGSGVHATSLKRANVELDLMLSLEMIGYFTDKPHSQQFPVPALKAIYPSTGNFIGVVGDLTSVGLTRKVRKLMAENSNIDVRYINAPRSMTGIDLSDHRSYWDQGYPALMITDTAFFRNPNYHTAQDTIETLDFTRMAEVVNGVFHVALRWTLK